MTEQAYDAMQDMTRALGAELQQTFRAAGVDATVVVAGSIFRLFFLKEPPQNYRQAALDCGDRHRWYSFWMLNHGIATRQGGCLSLPMTQEHTSRLLDETRSALREWPF
jgi:glutamate-1-semialdehyde aminotransferase